MWRHAVTALGVIAIWHSAAAFADQAIAPTLEQRVASLEKRATGAAARDQEHQQTFQELTETDIVFNRRIMALEKELKETRDQTAHCLQMLKKKQEKPSGKVIPLGTWTELTGTETKTGI